MTSSCAVSPASESGLRLSEILSALSYALDITEGQPQGHVVEALAAHLG